MGRATRGESVGDQLLDQQFCLKETSRAEHSCQASFLTAPQQSLGKRWGFWDGGDLKLTLFFTSDSNSGLTPEPASAAPGLR